jgi:hypothetical protein
MSGFGRKRPEKDETSTHDSYSQLNSTNWLGPLVMNNGVRIFPQSRTWRLDSYGNRSEVSH